jgi:predicted hydrocarbon binding protein
MSEKPDLFFETIVNTLQDAGLNLNKQENIDSVISDVIEKTLPESAKTLLKTLKSRAGEMLEEHRLIRQEFEARLLRRWARPLNLMEMLVVISEESGEMLNTEYRETARLNNDLVFEVLTRIHARACLSAYEALCLLRAGFSEGALTRWRTLHELSIVAFFIQKYGNPIAERYLVYEEIENYYEMIEYQKRCNELNCEPLNHEEIEIITAKKDQLISQFGIEFGKPFGWAAPILPKEKCNIKGLEAEIELDHLRPFYKMACNYVHSGPKGMSYRLGLIDNATSNILLCGPSNYGLANPGQNICISLNQITACLLTIAPNYERILSAKVMDILCEEACEAFAEVQEEIEREEEASS